MKKSKRQLFSRIAVICLFCTGVMVMTYPFYVNALNNFLDQQQMTYYLTKEKNVAAERQRLEVENERLKTEGLAPGADPFSESSSQKADEQYYQQHFIGKINIPKLAVELSLFDTTTPLLLEKGATVLDGTSYPVGGAGTHAVITAHRGLPERELFTNLPKLKKGDLFLIDILNQTLAYEVRDIQVVEPHETSLLQLVAEKDLVTLVTCTPYMINSHRLLVTGERVPYTSNVQKEQEAGNRQRFWEQMTIAVGIGIFLIVSIGMIAHQIYRFKLKNNPSSKSE